MQTKTPNRPLSSTASSTADSTAAEDSELARRVGLFLASRQWPALRHLEVYAEHGSVRVSGNVGSFYEKQLAQQCVLRVAGVQQLIDEVNVVDALPRSGDPARDSYLYHAWSDHSGLGV